MKRKRHEDSTSSIWADLPDLLLGMIKGYAHEVQHMLTINKPSDWAYFRYTSVRLPGEKTARTNVFNRLDMLIKTGNVEVIRRWTRFWKFQRSDIVSSMNRDGYMISTLGVEQDNLQVFRFLVKQFHLCSNDMSRYKINDILWHGWMHALRFIWDEWGGISWYPIPELFQRVYLYSNEEVVRFIVERCGLTAADIRSHNDKAIRMASQYNRHKEVVDYFAQVCQLSEEQLKRIVST